jgi:N-methylhydantoinase A
MRFIMQADLRHVGQGHEIVVELPWRSLGGLDLDRDVRPHFYEAYERLYGHAHPHLAVELTTCRLTAVGPAPRITLSEEDGAKIPAARGATRARRAYFAQAGGYLETPVYDRDRLEAGTTLSGPAILEGADSTALIPPGATAVVDRFLNVLVRFTEDTDA